MTLRNDTIANSLTKGKSSDCQSVDTGRDRIKSTKKSTRYARDSSSARDTRIAGAVTHTLGTGGAKDEAQAASVASDNLQNILLVGRERR